jgi:hypothetical protein
MYLMLDQEVIDDWWPSPSAARSDHLTLTAERRPHCLDHPPSVWALPLLVLNWIHLTVWHRLDTGPDQLLIHPPTAAPWGMR